MAPITLSLAAAALTDITADTVIHAALGIEARLAADFCGQVAQAHEEKTYRFDTMCRKFEVLDLILNDLYQTRRIELPVLHTLKGHVQVQLSQLCATQDQNLQEYRTILGVKQHFDQEKAKQETLVHDMEVREIVMLAVRDELLQREAGVEDTLLQGVDLSF